MTSTNIKWAGDKIKWVGVEGSSFWGWWTQQFPFVGKVCSAFDLHKECYRCCYTRPNEDETAWKWEVKEWANQTRDGVLEPTVLAQGSCTDRQTSMQEAEQWLRQNVL